MPQKKQTEILDLIRSRRSVRKYKKEPISDLQIEKILEAGRWAPSGLNNQPWRFVVIRDRSFRERISSMTHYSRIINDSDLCIAIFYNNAAGYHRDKDIMGIGACIQNMLLCAHSLGIGSVWLGEILKNKEKIGELLDIDMTNEFMALIAFGYPDEDPAGDRLQMNDLILKMI